MEKITDLKNGAKGTIVDLKGEERFLNRIIAMGLTIGCQIEVIQNHGKLPVLIYARDTLISLARNEAEKIMIG